MNKNYLCEEDQYKDTLNNEEISKIKDLELLNIRSKYWHLKHRAFMDEVNISDKMLESEYNRIVMNENKKSTKYNEIHVFSWPFLSDFKGSF